MGEPIDQDSFAEQDYVLFGERIRNQAHELQTLLRQPDFGAGPLTLGTEVEVSLVDDDAQPAPCNMQIVEETGAATEVDRFTAEYDTEPVPLAGRPFANLAADMRSGLADLSAAAELHGAQLALAGTLPTLSESVLLRPDIMTPEPRYRVLAAALSRHKFDDEIRIDGPTETVAASFPGIVAEGANSALQVHMRVPPNRFAQTLNAAHLASAPVLALAANSPFFLERKLWADNRIPIFAQAVSGWAAPIAERRVFLGKDWNRGGAAESFIEDVEQFEPIMPVIYDFEPDDDPPALHELRLHAGTVWRWNRPVYDPSGSGHVRIEFRALPTGPTIEDMIGNASLMIGATLALAQLDFSVWLPFEQVRSNLWAAAREGLSADLVWPDMSSGEVVQRPVTEVLAELIPAAETALRTEGVLADDVDLALASARLRLDRQINGSRWQVDTVRDLQSRMSRAEALAGMVQAMLSYGFDGPSVADWS